MMIKFKGGKSPRRSLKSNRICGLLFRWGCGSHQETVDGQGKLYIAHPQKYTNSSHLVELVTREAIRLIKLATKTYQVRMCFSPGNSWWPQGILSTSQEIYKQFPLSWVVWFDNGQLYIHILQGYFSQVCTSFGLYNLFFQFPAVQYYYLIYYDKYSIKWHT